MYFAFGIVSRHDVISSKCCVPDGNTFQPDESGRGVICMNITYFCCYPFPFPLSYSTYMYMGGN